jgi:hypothetical protein
MSKPDAPTKFPNPIPEKIFTNINDVMKYSKEIPNQTCVLIEYNKDQYILYQNGNSLEWYAIGDNNKSLLHSQITEIEKKITQLRDPQWIQNEIDDLEIKKEVIEKKLQELLTHRSE